MEKWGREKDGLREAVAWGHSNRYRGVCRWTLPSLCGRSDGV